MRNIAVVERGWLAVNVIERLIFFRRSSWNCLGKMQLLEC